MYARRFVSNLSLAFLLGAFVFAPVYAKDTGKAHSHAKVQAQQNTSDIKIVKPETVGFSSDALKKIDEGMKGIVDKKQLSGVVTLVARHGEVVQYNAYGYQNLENQTPMKVDTIFRIYSMTKPIAGAAMMMLYEEGKWKPEDPISKYIPEFANLKVYAGDVDGKPTYVAPNHAPTMGELMSHNAGFTYGNFGNTAVDKMYVAANPLGQPSLQAFIDTVAKLPLLYQPGEKWVYSVSVDIQGYLVQKLSGKTFPDFLEERIFKPLGMKDTGFYVPQEKVSRVANIYAWDASKSTSVLAPNNGIFTQPDNPATTKMPGLPSGGGGLYSTAHDYFRFAQMMLNGGELDGVRLLKPSTVALMRTNRLNDQTLNSNSGIGPARITPGQGFGFDFAVVKDPASMKTPVGKGSYWWWGIAGTWFWIDPTNDVVFVGMIQRGGGAPGAANHEDISKNGVYQALTHPEK